MPTWALRAETVICHNSAWCLAIHNSLMHTTCPLYCIKPTQMLKLKHQISAEVQKYNIKSFQKNWAFHSKYTRHLVFTSRTFCEGYLSSDWLIFLYNLSTPGIALNVEYPWIYYWSTGDCSTSPCTHHTYTVGYSIHPYPVTFDMCGW